MDPAQISPLSRVLVVDAIPANGLSLTLTADESQRAEMARLLELIALDALSAELMVTREGHRVRVLGRLTASVVQACVVTLEPVPAVIDEALEIVFAPQSEVDAAMRAAGVPDGDEELDADDLAGIDLAMLNDPDALPDPIVEGRIDVGRVVYEELAVALDPYPRKPGAQFEPPAEPEGFGSPFGALKVLKPN